MGIRWIIHKKDGQTITSDWNSNEISFRKSWSEDITSTQLQREEDKKLYTLSARKGSKTLFWQTDDFILDPNNGQSRMVARKIFKSLGEDNWLELILNNDENITINVINKKIKVI
jgi:phosphomannomutase